MNRIIGNSLFSIAGTLVSLLSGLVATAFVARLLGPEGSGTVALIIWIAMTAVAVAGFGGPQIILKYSASGLDGRPADLTSRVLMTVTPIAAVACLIVVAVAFLPLPDIETPVMLAGLFLFAVYFLFVFSTAAANGRGRFAETSLTTTIGCLFQLPLVIVGGILAGPAGALLGMAARYIPQAGLLSRYVAMPKPETRHLVTQPMWTYGRRLWLTETIDLLAMSRAELLVLGLFWSVTETGYFAVAIALFGFLGQFALQLSAVFIVAFSASNRQSGSGEDQEQQLDASVFALSLFMIPISLGGAAIVPYVVPLVFGEAFQPSVPAGILLMAAAGVSAISVVPWSFLAARGESRDLLASVTVCAAVSIGLMFALIPLFGVLGAAVARTVSELFFLVLLWWLVPKRTGARIGLGPVLKLVAAGSGCGITAYLVMNATMTLPGLVAAVISGAMVFAILVRLFRATPGHVLVGLETFLEEKVPGRVRPAAGMLVRLVLGQPAPLAVPAIHEKV